MTPHRMIIGILDWCHAQVAGYRSAFDTFFGALMEYHHLRKMDPVTEGRESDGYSGDFELGAQWVTGMQRSVNRSLATDRALFLC